MTADSRSRHSAEPDVAQAAAWFAVAARAEMLLRLADQDHGSAGELATAAGVSPSTASGHLAYLVDNGLLTVERHGRQRRYRLAGPQVRAALEALRLLAGKCSAT